ncbi:MAG: hypothetical protein INR62_08520 [Rhodospirillales bacterium]|nr:hypothetical protein [Acetobacter sp.]
MTHKTCTKLGRVFEESDDAPLRALHSLTETQAEALQSEMFRSGEDWCFERHVAHDGHLLLLINPPAARGATISFALHRDVAGFHLSAWREDEHVALSTSRGVVEVAAAIRRALRDGVVATAAA